MCRNTVQGRLDKEKLKELLRVDSKQVEVINKLGYDQDRMQILHNQLCTSYNELDVSMKALWWNLSRLQVKDDNSRQDYGTQRDAAIGTRATKSLNKAIKSKVRSMNSPSEEAAWRAEQCNEGITQDLRE